MTISHMEQRGFYTILLTATLLHVSERSLVEAQVQAQVAKKCTKSWFYDCMEDWDRVPGSWGEWTQVSSCSATCGNGTKTQARKCSRGSVHYLGITYTNIVSCDGTIVPPGSEEDWNMTTTEYATTSCETKRPCPCPKGKFSVKEGLPHISCGLCPAGQGYTCLKDWDRVPGSWSEWTPGNCYATCGFGTMAKTRHCSRGSVTKGDITLEHAVSCDGTVVGLDNHVNPKNDWETKTIGCNTGTLCPCHNKTLSERLGDKFHVHWKYMNYQDAAQKCKDDGFTLAMPKTLEKQQEMMNQIRHDTQGESSETRFWIGFTGSSNGGFTWADGESVGWTNWWTNQPNSGSKSECGEIVKLASWSWSDDACWKTNYFICQEVSLDLSGKSRRWKLVTTTSSDSDAGTGYKVDVFLCGSKKNTSRYTIESSQLHRGQEDTFYLNFNNDIGDITMLKLQTRNGAFWKVNSIVLTNLDSMKEYHFENLNGMLVGDREIIYPDACSDITMTQSGVTSDTYDLADQFTETYNGQSYWVKVKLTKITDLQLVRAVEGSSCTAAGYGIRDGGIFIDLGCQAVLRVCGKPYETDIAQYCLDLNALKRLLRKDTDVNDWNECLHLAAEYGNMAIINLLLTKGADPNAVNVHVNAVNTHLETPLHEAAFHGHMEVAERLLRAGARKDVKDENGTTPADVARVRGNPEIADLIEAFQYQQYHYYSTWLTQPRAAAYCQKRGMKLLRPLTKAQYDSLKRKCLDGGIIFDNDVWTDLTKNDVQGLNDVVGYNLWKARKSNGDHFSDPTRCIQMSKLQPDVNFHNKMGFQFDDIDCDNNRPFVCERDPICS